MCCCTWCFWLFVMHCKDKMPKIWNKYSQKRNIGASVPISTFMCLWANYIFPRWVCLFCWRKYPGNIHINRSQTHECGNWGWGRAIPRKGIYKRNCRCSVVSEVPAVLFCSSMVFNGLLRFLIFCCDLWWFSWYFVCFFGVLLRSLMFFKGLLSVFWYFVVIFDGF